MPGDAPQFPSTEIPEAVRSLVQLFERHLGGVSFPGLAADSLTELLEETETGAADVARASEALAEAQKRLAHARRQLLAQARKALGYAKVYAEEEPALASQLAQVQLERPRVAAKPRRARRPRAKVPPSSVPATAATGEQPSLGPAQG